MYQELRQQLLKEEPQFREVCKSCMQPMQTCYCPLIQKVDLNFQFVILIHPIEARRRIATGRMSHLCLSNSKLIRGHDFSKNKTVNEMLVDTGFQNVILYPGQNSHNLTLMSKAGRSALCPPGKRLRIFVLDGTWATAKKMLKHSQNLRELPRICFTPSTPSNFRVRKQPREGFYSTIEAIHHTIELLGPSYGFDPQGRQHDSLLRVFDSMVDLQLKFRNESEERAGPPRYMRARREV